MADLSLRAEAVAIKDGTFVYVGDAAGVEEYIGPKTEVSESGDGMFMPGFCDAHMHFSSGAGQFAYEIDIVGLETVDQYIDTIREYVEKNPGREFYKGMGRDNAVFENEGKTQTEELLDAVCPDAPMLIGSYDGHSYRVNSKCLEKAGIGRGFASREVGTIVLDPATSPAHWAFPPRWSSAPRSTASRCMCALSATPPSPWRSTALSTYRPPTPLRIGAPPSRTCRL